MTTRDKEIFGFHWHPRGRSWFRLPHLHLEHGAQVGQPEVRAAHFPTGRIPVELFLRFVIDTFRLKTRRKDCRSALQRTHEAFRKWQTRT